ncbi:MAG: FISUMP domain-containing protein [Bacteroidota bacterium]
MYCFNLKRNQWVKLFLLFTFFSFHLTFLNGQGQSSKETNSLSNSNRNRFSMDELKVRWKKLALETCVTVCSTPPSISSIITTGVITASTASFSGNILSDGGSPVLAKGIIWSTSPNPTIALSTKTNDGPGVGPFTSNITGLNAGTTYYVRFYVSNSSGSTYGTEINFVTGTGSLATIGSTVSTGSITATSATSGGNISSDGGYPGTVRGVVWATSTNPTVPSAFSTSDGTGTGAFTSNITGLSATTLYYVRSYATNPAGTTYGSEISFTTLVGSSPSISSTSAIGSITTTSASSGGNISSDGGYAITARGVVWGTSPSPTVPSASSTTNGTGTGSFTSNITGLSVGTLYYVRSYATNSAGTSYGTEISFTTSAGSLATMSATVSATSITPSTATSGGNITADGGSPITARGVVWATTTNPTESLSTKTTDGAGTGAFTSNITGLTAGTLYYVRSYATNTAGTSYGTQMSFTTSTGSLATISATVAATSITSSGATSGGNITADGGSSITARGVVWGTTTSPTISLSTKTADGTGTGSFTSNITGLYASTLYYVRSYATNAAGTSYGTEISFTTNIGSTPTLSATSAISAITTTTASSGGNITAEGDSPITARGVVWGTATSPTTSLSTKTSNGTGIGSFTSNITGLSLGTTYYVRSYATNSSGTSYGTEISFTTSAGSLATMSATVSATSITTSAATSGGNITADGGSPITARGVVWNTSTSPTISLSTKTSNGTGTGAFTSNITGLSAGTLYYVRSYATNTAGTSYGTQISFTTLASCTCASTATCPSTVTDRESNSYDVLTLGGQCWMKQNLRVTTLNDGTAIPVDAGGGTTGNGAGYTGWATRTTSAMTVYEHDANNIPIYGYLYNQYAVNDSKGLCPSGWRVPTDTEWTTLSTCLGGESVAGEKMKLAGTTYWMPNYDANNCSDFSGYPGGFRRNDGLFYFKAQNAYFWTSTSAKNRALSGTTKNLSASNDANSYQQNVGLSVRCIKN